MSQLAARSNARPSPLNLMHRACQRIDDLFIANAGKGGVTPRQFAVMRALATQKDVSQTEISEASGIDRSTLADIVRRLVEKGWVQRKRTKEDARMYAVRLTDNGRDILTLAGNAARAADNQLLAVLNSSEREQFVALLARLVEADANASATKKAALAPKRLKAK